jgi:hypothetical protein
MLIKNSFHLIEMCINCETDEAHVTHADRNSRNWIKIGIQHSKSVIEAVTFKTYNSSNLKLEEEKEK